jgi:metallo-beta-lactamase family protein
VERVSPVRIFGETYELRAQVRTINALSAHADHDELLDYFRRMGPEVERAFVVHGESEASEQFAADLAGLGAREVMVPEEAEPYVI